MSLDERFSEGYEPKFDVDYAWGEQGQIFTHNLIEALGTDRIEVKHDAPYLETGNIYVEYECLRKGKYRLSGIGTTTADWWVFVLDVGKTAVIVDTVSLREAARNRWRQPRHRVECKRGSHPTRGVKIELAWLLQFGTRTEQEH